MSVKIQLRRGTAAEWAAANPVLAAGEVGVETDTRVFRVGDGVTAFTALPAFSSAASVRTRTAAGAADTLVLDDAGRVVEYTNAALVTVTVPPNGTVGFEVGSIVGLYAAGAAGFTLVADAGVTIRNNDTNVPQYGEISLRKRATNEWVRAG